MSKIPCRWCSGTGYIAVEAGSTLRHRCTDCGGTGEWTNPEDDIIDDVDDADDNESDAPLRSS
jgi:hypothetical protein